MPFGLFSGLYSTNKQIQHDLRMYNLQRGDYLADREHSEVYNSPSAQVQRLKDAGLNPSLAMNNVQTGSVNSPSSPNVSPSNVTMAGQNLTQGILGLMGFKQDQQLKEAQARDIAADAKLKEINGFTQLSENFARIRKLLGEGRESWKRGDHIDAIETARYNDFLSQIGERAASAELKWAEHALKVEQLKYLPVDKALSWVETIGGIMESASRREVNKRQAEYLIEKKTAEIFGWKGKKFENELNEEARKWLLRGIKVRGTPSNFQQGILTGSLEAGDGFNHILGLW